MYSNFSSRRQSNKKPLLKSIPIIEAQFHSGLQLLAAPCQERIIYCYIKLLIHLQIYGQLEKNIGNEKGYLRKQFLKEYYTSGKIATKKLQNLDLLRYERRESIDKILMFFHGHQLF